jgi:GAF domain-containing protein
MTEILSVALELERGIITAGSADDQSSRLLEFMRSAMESLSTRPPLTENLKQVSALLASDSAAFWAVDAKTGMLRMVAAHGTNADGFLPVPRGQGLAGWVAEHHEVLAIEDAPADPRCLFPNEARESGIGSYLGAPVFSGDQVEGVLEVHMRRPRPWPPPSVSALKSAALALGAINRGIPIAEHESPAAAQPPPDAGLRAESAYMTMSQTLESLGSKEEVIEAMVEVLGHALGVSRVIAIEKGGQTGYLNAGVIKHEYHIPEVPSTLGAMMPEEFFAPLFQGEGQGPLVISDSAAASPMPRDTIARLHVCSELMVPLKLHDDVIALIDIQECNEPRQWTRDEIEFADKLAHQASITVAHLAALEKTSRDLETARTEARRASDVATRARGIVDSVPEAILGLDRDGRLTFFNATGRVRYKLKNEDLGRMVGMVESLTLSDESIWEKVNASHGIVRFEATIAPPRAAAPLAAPDRRAARARNAVALPISIAVAPVRSEKDEITGRILVLTDLSHTRPHSKKDTGEQVAALEAKMKETQEALSEAHKVIESAAAGAAATGRIAYAAGEIEKVRTDEARARNAAQQLLEINRLKSDFIVNAGRELDASLQSVLAFSELLGQGQYGQLTPEQLEAIKGIYAWARRMKNDVDWLIEYGSTRSRTLESAAEEVPE